MWPAWLRRPAPLPFGYELKGMATHDRLEVPLPPWDRVRHHVFHLPLGRETCIFHLPDPYAQHRFRPGRRYALAIHANLNWAWFRDQALRLSQSVAEDRASPAPKEFSLLTACAAGPGTSTPLPRR